MGIIGFCGLESSTDGSVGLVLGARIIDKSLGNARQATVLISVSKAASLTTIGNHPLSKLGGHYC
jgi:hypothetical protein